MCVYACVCACVWVYAFVCSACVCDVNNNMTPVTVSTQYMNYGGVESNNGDFHDGDVSDSKVTLGKTSVGWGGAHIWAFLCAEIPS